MNDMPIVSIVTPSYNQAQYLEETILSVLNQDYPQIEYIVIDGGSIDGSVDVIRKYENRLAFWVSEKDRGQSHAISKGWKRAKGEFLAYLNSDDTYVVPDAVSKAVNALHANPDWGMVYGDCGIIDENGKLIGLWAAEGFDLKQLLLLCRIGQPTVFIRRSAIEAVDGLDESFYLAMDYDLWMRIGLRLPVGCLPGHRLANYRVHNDAKSSAQALRFTEENERVIRRTLSDPLLPYPHEDVANQAYGALYFRHAAMLVGRGQQTEARPWFWRAVRLYPGVVRMYAPNNQFFWVLLSVILGARGMELGVRFKRQLRELLKIGAI